MKRLKRKHLVIRVDAGGEIGTGHLMRCLALAQAWQDAGGRVIFIIGFQNEGLRQRLQKEGFDIHQLAYLYPHNGDWDNTRSLLADQPDAWVVLDGYHFGEIYQKQVKDTGHKLLVIDDMAHLKHYYADIVLNQSLHAEPSLYSVEPGTRLLLGTHYALLNRDFLAWKDWRRDVPGVARRVLVTLGGSDSSNNTLKVVQALQDVAVPGLEAKVVAGASNPHAAVLETAIRQSRLPMSLIYDARNMPELMAWADVAVSAGGITAWELAFMGLPSLIGVTAENQIDVGKSMEKADVAQELGWFADVSKDRIRVNLQALLNDAERRQVMSARGREFVDGYGTQRVCAALVADGFYLRPVRREDGRLLWEWANDPEARRAALSTEPIPFENHTRWFEEKFASDNTVILILERDAVPVGQIRFDLDCRGNAEIDIYITSANRRQSLGTYLLREGTRRYAALNKKRVKAVIGHVRPENLPSCYVFEKAGFQRMGVDTINDIPLVRFVWPKGEAR